MSKNIVIEEGGIGRNLTAEKLKTALVGGGSCLWVPEDEMALTVKSINQNGTYTAASDGFYGYSQVTVSGVGTVTGRDKNTGHEVIVTKDPETGEIVETAVPVEIRVIEPPTNPYGIYTHGQTILKDGMVVKAYGANGEEMQTVSLAEITIDPTVAAYDPDTDQGGESSYDLDAAPWPSSIKTTRVIDAGSNPDDPEMEYVATDGVIGVRLWEGGFGATMFMASDHDGVIGYEAQWPRAESPYIQNWYASPAWEYEGKTVYMSGTLVMSTSQDRIYGVVNESVEGSVTDADKKAAWIMVYGNKKRAGSVQQITVTWPRPGDGQVLETTFDILVAPPYSSEEE